MSPREVGGHEGNCSILVEVWSKDAVSSSSALSQSENKFRFNIDMQRTKMITLEFHDQCTQLALPAFITAGQVSHFISVTLPGPYCGTEHALKDHDSDHTTTIQ